VGYGGFALDNGAGTRPAWESGSSLRITMIGGCREKVVLEASCYQSSETPDVAKGKMPY